MVLGTKFFAELTIASGLSSRSFLCLSGARRLPSKVWIGLSN